MCIVTYFVAIQKKIVIKERPFCKKSLDSSDVFILDLGLEIYQVCSGILLTGQKDHYNLILHVVEWQDLQQR